MKKISYSLTYSLLGFQMKRVYVTLFVLTTMLIVSSLQVVLAADELYMWELHNEGANVTAEYQIHITASDSWEAETPYEVDVKLISKNYYSVKIDSAKVILNRGKSFKLESLSKQEPTVLTKPSDYWKETFSFNLPTDKLVNGQNFTVTAIAIVSLSSIAGSSEGLNGTWDNYDNPVTARLYFSSQSTSSPEPTPTPPEGSPYSIPAIVVIGPVIAIAIGLGLLVYFKKRKH
jgi:hypothetical protein